MLSYGRVTLVVNDGLSDHLIEPLSRGGIVEWPPTDMTAIS
jgi:hypothetical protein